MFVDTVVGDPRSASGIGHWQGSELEDGVMIEFGGEGCCLCSREGDQNSSFLVDDSQDDSFDFVKYIFNFSNEGLENVEASVENTSSQPEILKPEGGQGIQALGGHRGPSHKKLFNYFRWTQHTLDICTS